MKDELMSESGSFKYPKGFLFAYGELFIANWNTYIQQYDNRGTIGYKQPKGKFNYGKLLKTLDGKITTGVFPITPTGKAKELNLDIDEGGKPYAQKVLYMVSEELKLDRRYLHVNLSGSKGYHIRIFLTKLIRADVVVDVGRKLQRRMKQITGGKHSFEIRPENPKGGRGAKLPLAVHKKTGVKAEFVDETFKVVPDQQAYIISMLERRVDLKVFVDYLQRGKSYNLPDIELAEKYEKNLARVTWSPCLEKVTSQIIAQPGIRNSLLGAMGRWLRSYCSKGLKEIQYYLGNWYRKYRGKARASIDENDREIERVVASIEANGKFSCNYPDVAPILKPHCNDRYCPLLRSKRAYIRVPLSTFHHPEFIKLKPACIQVYMELLWRKSISDGFLYQGERVFYGSVEDISQKIGRSPSTVKRAIGELKAEGLLVKVPFDEVIRHRGVLAKNNHLLMRMIPNYYILYSPDRDNIETIEAGNLSAIIRSVSTPVEIPDTIVVPKMNVSMGNTIYNVSAPYSSGYYKEVNTSLSVHFEPIGGGIL